MELKSNAHTHSTYCDGKNSLEEMIISSIRKGFHTIGFSGHSYLSFDDSYPMSLENTQDYLKELRVLKEKYKNQIDIIIGLELDYYSSDINMKDYEYILGSCHHLYSPITHQYYAFDNTAEEMGQLLNEGYAGHLHHMMKDYADHLIEMIQNKPIDIIGHLDLMKKYNFNQQFFDESDETYNRYLKDIIDEGIKKDCIFEINTGGIYRNCHQDPYPSPILLRYIAQHNGKVMINSDSHDIDSLDFYFKEAIEYAKKCNVKEIYFLTKNGFEKENI